MLLSKVDNMRKLIESFRTTENNDVKLTVRKPSRQSGYVQGQTTKQLRAIRQVILFFTM